jgi:hypothetical protein
VPIPLPDTGAIYSLGIAGLIDRLTRRPLARSLKVLRSAIEPLSGVASLDKSGVTLSSGEHIQAETVIWAAGIRAAPLTRQIPAERDNFGRLLVDRDLHVPGGRRRLRHRRCRTRGLRRCRQLRADVVPARHADGRLRWQQCRRGIAGRADQAISPEGLRHLPRSAAHPRTSAARSPWRNPELITMNHETVRAAALAVPLTSPAFPPGPFRFVSRECFVIQ